MKNKTKTPKPTKISLSMLAIPIRGERFELSTALGPRILNPLRLPFRHPRSLKLFFKDEELHAFVQHHDPLCLKISDEIVA